MEPWERKWVDYYQELGGLTPSTPNEIIQVAYRRLARRYHPDSGEEPDPERMKRINAAYEVLSDPRRRGRYDLAYEHQRSSPGPPGPKVYAPIIEVDQTDVEVECKEGQPARFEFTVRHVGGDLPPGWFLAVEKNGEILQGVHFEMDPPNNFPARITVTIPPRGAGDYEGTIELSIQQRA